MHVIMPIEEEAEEEQEQEQEQAAGSEDNDRRQDSGENSIEKPAKSRQTSDMRSTFVQGPEMAAQSSANDVVPSSLNDKQSQENSKPGLSEFGKTHRHKFKQDLHVRWGQD